MPRLPKNALPSLNLHRATGQGFVRLHDGTGYRTIYCGKFGTKQAERKYNATLAAWLANDRKLPADLAVTPRGQAPEKNGDGILIAELLAAYLVDQRTYFTGSGDGPSRSFERIKAVVRILDDHCGDIEVNSFGPVRLRVLRDKLADDPAKSRAYVNELMNSIRAVFLWGVSQEMVKSDTHYALKSLKPLKRGKTKAREGKGVKTIDNATVKATIKHVSKAVGDMIRLQMLCGARPGEIVLIRPCDVNTTGKTWTFKPHKHKTENYDIERTIYFYEPAQKILAPYLKRDSEAYCFSPAEVQAERLAKLHKQRKTPLSCGNKPGTNKRAKPQHKPGDCYTPVSYARAITRGCARAFPPPKGLDKEAVRAWDKKHCWQPNRLRHNFATLVEEHFDIDTASMYLDHTDVKTTKKYANAKRLKIAAAEAQMNKLLAKNAVV